MGNAFAFTGDFSKALEAAGRVFELLDRKPKIDANHNVGLKLNQVEGKLRIRDGEFCYPTRRDIQVLNRLSLSIKTGEKIALVGESGCGKSTVIQIIQRLYDLDKGCLDLQGTNIEALNLPYVRYLVSASVSNTNTSAGTVQVQAGHCCSGAGSL